MTSDNYGQRRGKYVQPITVAQMMEIIREHDRKGHEKLKRLRDEWDQDDDRWNNRTDVVRRTVYDLAWYVDHDPEKVLRVMKKRPLYKNWSGGEREIRMFVEASIVEDSGHYSAYPDNEDENENEYSDGPDGSPDNGGNNASEPTKEPDSSQSHRASASHQSNYEETKRDLRRNLLGIEG